MVFRYMSNGDVILLEQLVYRAYSLSLKNHRISITPLNFSPVLNLCVWKVGKNYLLEIIDNNRPMIGENFTVG